MELEKLAGDPNSLKWKSPELSVDDVLGWLYELEAEWRWKKDEPRCGYQSEYERLCADIKKLESVGP